jgi:hypothetical protein
VPHRLQPPQFGLRTLLIAVAACGVLCALARWLEPVVIVAIIFVGATLFCHVAGNAIGTRLRSIGSQPDALDSPLAARGRMTPQPQDFAPATHLGQRKSLGWTIIVASSIGVAAGAIGGGFWTFVAAHGHAGPLDISVGVIAFAILGGLGSFAAVAFAQVLLGAIFQALTATPQRRIEPAGDDSF